MQRCNKAKDSIEESKKTMIRTLECRELVMKVIEGGRSKQKASSRQNGSNSSRGAKKKKGL